MNARPFRAQRPARTSAKFAPVLALFLFISTFSVGAEEAFGAEQEVRFIKLVDGRTLIARVMSADAEKMNLEVPQGGMAVNYESLSEVEVLDAQAYEEQAPLRIGLSPTVFNGRTEKALAQDIDRWLGDLVALVPGTEVLSSKRWAQELADRGTMLRGCSGDASCLRPLADELELDRILIPKLGEGDSVQRTLRLGTVINATGGFLKPAFPTSLVSGDRTLPAQSSGELLQGVFASLGFEPSIDVPAVAASAFPQEDTEAVATTAPAVRSVEVTPREQEPRVTTLTPQQLAPSPLRPKWSPSPKLNLGLRKSVGLAFLPVPGLAAALQGDKRGFALSLIGTVGLSWASVYAFGRLARTAEAFWAPSILSSYAICVGLNQLSLALTQRKAARSAARVPAKSKTRPTASLGPLFSEAAGERAEPQGAALLIQGSF